MGRRNPICPECGEKITRAELNDGDYTRCGGCGCIMCSGCGTYREEDMDIDYCSDCYNNYEEYEEEEFDDGDPWGDDGRYNENMED